MHVLRYRVFSAFFTLPVLLSLSSTIHAFPYNLSARATNTTWPLPHNITGDSEPGADTITAGWGGIHVHDPTVILGSDSHYYSISTHGGLALSRASVANSLDGYWSIIGSVLPDGSIIDNADSTDPWAPDVHLVNGTYYCYYAVSVSGSMTSSIGLATSSSLDAGTWTDHGALLHSGGSAAYPLNTSNAIDPNLITDPTTNISYLNYGSFWSGIFQFEMQPSLLAVDTAVGPAHLALEPASNHPLEGSYMHYNDGWFYLFFSHGQCCSFDASALPAAGDEYSIRVGRSQSVTGPFVDADGVDLLDGGGLEIFGSHDYVYAPGGQGVLSGYSGRDVIYYHYVNTAYDPTYADDLKLLGYNYLDYVDGWPVLVY